MKWKIEYFEQEDTNQPFDYWIEYLRTRHISPVQEENDE